MKNRFLFFLPILVVGLLFSPPAIPSARALWVTRYDFKSAADVVQIMENARYLGTNRVFFQVRGNATVCYPSAIEPWAWELTGNSPETIGMDPGWDPLAVALSEAAKNGLELHAWLNVFPGWRGVVPAPPGTKHPWVTHRSWFIIDHQGVLLRPTQSFYSFLSPGIPAVRSYLAKVFGEVVKRYPKLEGIHLDYIRYPGRTEVGNFRDFSYDRESVEAYKKSRGKTPQYNDPDWQRFKCEQVNASIQSIRSAIRNVSPKIQLSATCFANIRAATEEKGQDPRDWLENNLVDWVIPMVYDRNTKDFTTKLDTWNRAFEERWLNRMWIGVNVDFNNENEIIRQMTAVQKFPYEGLALFAYSSLFPGHKANRKAETVRTLWQEEILRDVLQRSVPPATQ